MNYKKKLKYLIAIFFVFNLSAGHAIMYDNASFSNIKYETRGGEIYASFDLRLSLYPYSGKDPVFDQDNRCNRPHMIQLFFGQRVGANGGGPIDVVNFGPADMTPGGQKKVSDVARAIGMANVTTITRKITNLKLGPVSNPNTEIALWITWGDLSFSSYNCMGGGDQGSAGDLGQIDIPGVPGTTSCTASVTRHVAHGGISLPAVGNEHRASGIVAVACNRSSSVTMSTGNTGSRRINSDLSTEILIDGSSNRNTKTVNTSGSFTVTSRLHRTANTGFTGGFTHPVVLTVSWP